MGLAKKIQGILKKKPARWLNNAMKCGVITSLIIAPQTLVANQPANQSKTLSFPKESQTKQVLYICPKDIEPTEFLKEDWDKDGLSNEEEFMLGTNYKNPDSDGDGIVDGEELEKGSNPKINNPNFFIALNSRFTIFPHASENISESTTEQAGISTKKSISGSFGGEISNKPKMQAEAGLEKEISGVESTAVEKSHSQSIKDYILTFSLTFYNNLPEDITLDKIMISPEYNGHPFSSTLCLEENFQVESKDKNPQKYFVKNYSLSIPKQVYELIENNPKGLDLNLFYLLGESNGFQEPINMGERNCGKVVLYDNEGKAIDSVFIFGEEDIGRSIKEVLEEKYKPLSYENSKLMLKGEEIRVYENNKDITPFLEERFDNEKEYHIVPFNNTLRERVLALFNRKPATSIEADLIGNGLDERVSAKLKDIIRVEGLGSIKEREYNILDNNNLPLNPLVLALNSTPFMPSFGLYMAGNLIMDTFFGEKESFYIDDMTTISYPNQKDHLVVLGRYFSPEKQGETRIYELHTFNDREFRKECYYKEGLNIEDFAIPGDKLSEELDSKILFIGYQENDNTRAVYGISPSGEISKKVGLED
jgi:hypothetical protein